MTLGGGCVRFATEWDHPADGLGFIQVHSYSEVRYQDRDVSVFGRTAASFELSKPLARDGGYLGAWPWSFKGVDAFGAVDRSRIRY